jgi:hypothetical protein
MNDALLFRDRQATLGEQSVTPLRVRHSRGGAERYSETVRKWSFIGF